MVLWPKKKSKTEQVLLFNKKELQEQINNLSSHLYEYRNDTGTKILKELMLLARNIQILEFSSQKSQDFHMGRLSAFSDIINYIERAEASKKEELKEGEKPVRESIKMNGIRRTSNQAGAAI